MRRVVTLFEARGADQIRAQLGQMRSGFAENRREMDMWGRSGGYVNNQLRALGTTLRYAFAGSAIFGTMQMVRNLGQFQAKLGEIQAIATGPGGIPLINSQIDDLGSRLIDVSNKTTQPIADLQEGVLSLYSTIGDVPQNQAADMMNTISTVAITAQSNIQDTTQALLGMLNAFGRGTQELPRFGDEFFKVIQLSAGMPGSIYAQKLGPLAASASLGNFTPEQMGALAIGATRFGGAPSTNMTYLAQMMMYLMHPTTAKAKGALAGIGLGEQQRQRLGGYATLKKFLAAVNARGGIGMSSALASASDDFLNQADAQGLGATDVGLSGGGSKLISDAFGRIQSQRMAAILSRLLTPQQVAGTENKTLDEYLADVSNSAGEADRAMGRAMDYRRIVQAGNAMHNFGIEIGTALSPLLQYPARGLTAGVRGFSNQKWGLGPISGQELELGAGGAGIFMLLRTLARGGMRGRGIAGLGAIGAASDLMTETGRGNTPANPLYVAVVYSLSGPGSLTGGRGGAGGPIVGGVGGAAEAEARAASRFSRLRAGAGRAGVVGLLATTGATAAYELSRPGGTFGYSRGDENHTLLDYLMHARTGGFAPPRVGVGGLGGGTLFRIGGHGISLSPAEQRIIDAFKSGDISGNAAEARLRAMTTHAHFQAAGLTSKVQGRAELTVHVEQPGAKRKTQHVAVDLFPDFTTPAPQVKAKDKSYRGGQ